MAGLVPTIPVLLAYFFARGDVSAIRLLGLSWQVQANVEAVDARGGRTLDPRNHGAQGHCREAGQYPYRGNLRKMRRAKSRLGGERREPREIRLQAMRTQAGDALTAPGPCLARTRCSRMERSEIQGCLVASQSRIAQKPVIGRRLRADPLASSGLRTAVLKNLICSSGSI
jgi:hypothetical protein